MSQGKVYNLKATVVARLLQISHLVYPTCNNENSDHHSKHTNTKGKKNNTSDRLRIHILVIPASSEA